MMGTKRSRTLVLSFVAGLGALLTAPVAAQTAPRATVSGGVGNAYGWFGGQVEAYVAEGRVSGFGGLGYMPNLLNDEGNGVAGAVGLRGYTPGLRHRGLFELAWTVLSNSVFTQVGSDVVVKEMHYGPSVALGYRFTGSRGLTVSLSAGVGFDRESLDVEGSSAQPTIGIGVGYTWR